MVAWFVWQVWLPGVHRCKRGEGALWPEGGHQQVAQAGPLHRTPPPLHLPLRQQQHWVGVQVQGQCQGNRGRGVMRLYGWSLTPGFGWRMSYIWAGSFSWLTSYLFIYWLNQHTSELISTQKTSCKHNNRPESLLVTLTWHAFKYKVNMLHQRYILMCLTDWLTYWLFTVNWFCCLGGHTLIRP